jgi:hypothetical protein
MALKVPVVVAHGVVWSSQGESSTAARTAAAYTFLYVT